MMPTQDAMWSPTLEVPLTPGWDIVLTDNEDFAVIPTTQSVPTIVSAMTYEPPKLPDKVKTPHLERTKRKSDHPKHNCIVQPGEIRKVWAWHLMNAMEMVEPVHKESKTHKKRCSLGVLYEIRKFQKATENIIPLAPFVRLVKNVLADFDPGLHMVHDALAALQEASEAQLVLLFERANLAAIHAGCVTVIPKDIQVVQQILSNKNSL